MWHLLFMASHNNGPEVSRPTAKQPVHPPAPEGASWDELVGPFLRSDGVQARLGADAQSIDALAAQRCLLRTITADGEQLYPLWQFDGDHLVGGLIEVLAMFPEDSVDGWTLAAWLRTPDPELDEPPFDALARGERENVWVAAGVAARSFASSDQRFSKFVAPHDFDDPLPEAELAMREDLDVWPPILDTTPITKAEREQILGYDPKTGV